MISKLPEFNFQLLMDELKRVGCTITPISSPYLFLASYQLHNELLFDITLSKNSYTASWMASDKFFTKKLLERANISVPRGKSFSVSSSNLPLLLSYAEEITYPVVLKPTQRSHGEFVFSLIENEKELKKTFSRLIKQNPNENFLIEKHIMGEEYRLFITKNDFFAAVHRSPSEVEGDGVHSIKELIKKINYKRMNPRKNCLCTIKIDQVVRQFLAKNDLELTSIPSKNKIVRLRPTTNVSMGGNCVDVTNQVHPDFKNLAKEVLNRFFGIQLLGIDVICDDISNSLSTQNYSICEVGTTPGLSLHTLPANGHSQPTPEAVAKLAFPEAYD